MITAASFTAEDGVPPARRSWALSGVLGAMVLVVLDSAIVNVALPTIGLDLHVTPAVAVRTVTAYQLGLVVALFPAAALGEWLGFRRVFVAGVTLFTVASMLCALAPSLDWLVAARFLQGTGGAAIMALGVALLRFVVPKHRLGDAIGWNALTVALSAAAGPTLGAMILSVASWPWLFAVNAPIGAFVLLAARYLPDAQGAGRALDGVSVGLNALTFGFLVIGAECFAYQPASAAVLVAAAAVSGALLVRREANRRAPLIPLDLLRRSSFRVSVIASILCFTGQAAALVALPFHLQHAYRLTPLMTAVFLSPWPLTVAVAGPLAGRLAGRISTSLLCAIGGVVLAIGLSAAAWLQPGQASGAFILCMMLCGFGFGFFNVPNNRNIFLSAPRERSGAAGGMQGVARLTGQTAGAVCMTLLFQFCALGAAPRLGLYMGALLTLAAGLTSLLRPFGRTAEHEARTNA